MANKVETYTGDITEFVDWITGNDSNTNTNVTDNKQVSGSSIRKLLQSRLKEPIYLYYDQTKGYYRGFSSQEAYRRWVDNPVANESLQLFYFVAPSPYTVVVDGLPTDTKYIEMASISSDGKLSYTWRVDSSNEEGLSVQMSVVYRVNGVVRDTVRYGVNERTVTYDLSEFLTTGTNEIQLSFNSVGVAASTTKTVTLYCVQLDLSSSFTFYNVVDKTELVFNVPYQIDGSDGYIRYINYSIDGATPTRIQISDTASFSVSGRLQIPTANISAGKHTLQIYCDVTINNITYYSNLLYYEFIANGLTTYDYMTSLVKANFSGLKNNIFTSANPVQFTATQYEQFSMDWAFYTSHPTKDTQTVEWRLVYDTTDDSGEVVSNTSSLTSIKAISASKLDALSFFPEIYNNEAYLKPYVGSTNIDGAQYKLKINKSSSDIKEASGYVFKLAASGKTNSMPEAQRNVWSYTDSVYQVTYATTFNNMTWDNNSGWVDNALVLSNGASALVHFNPFSDSTLMGGLNFNSSETITGRTFEIDFETFNVDDTTKPVCTLGTIGGASIQITPNSAIVTGQDGNTIVKTNFKENERVRLSFIINSNNATDSHLNNTVFICNNGILERAASLTGKNLSVADVTSNGVITNGITLDGTSNGIKIYSMKCYPQAISYDSAFYNYVLDSGKIAELLRKNNVYSNNEIDESLCEDRIDVILMEGDVEAVIADTTTTKDVSKPVKIKRICRESSSFNFTIVNARLRKHGQSTLNYAIPSFKIWTDYSWSDAGGEYADRVAAMYNSSEIEDMTDEELTTHKLYKGRYQMKTDSIPCRKFVLQANYADSSGVHNGGLERLINDTWYNATVNGEYVLRTDPQQYVTSTGKYKSNGWYEATNTTFPYKLRIAPDSFPCVIFYRQSSTDSYTFLGQYVFMDDKKSDFIYGERSIYKVPSDPFCLTEQFKSYDKAEYRLWNNKDVKRMEIILLNNNFVNYTSMTMGDVKWDDVITDTQGNWQFAWQQNIEQIYPDPEDYLEDITDATSQQAAVRSNVSSFTNWVTWLVSTYNAWKATATLKADGTYDYTTGDYSKFRTEASDHLDLYKLAAYYIFCLRYGLVDSMQRNVQVKTYDGTHFHYEPWDMDIAMGSRNTGGIAYEPPITRQTLTQEDMTSEDTSGLNNFALSGHDCWLWNALENWTTTASMDGWIDRIVPKVAQALYVAGLTYDNSITMFDTNYQDKWCERIYNSSGYFKYVQEGEGNYLKFLNGARTTHRHWWLKTSFDFYDSVWSCGEFITKHVGMQVDKPTWATDTTGFNPGRTIKVTAAAQSYFSISQESTMVSSGLTKKGETAELTYSTFDFANISSKQYNYINGAVNIEGLDVSCLTEQLQNIDLKGCYDSSLGQSRLKTLNVGIPWEGMVTYGVFHKYPDGLSFDTTGATFDRLEELNVQGMYLNSKFPDFLKSLSALKKFYAAGSNITSFTSGSGCNYSLLQLPDGLTTLNIIDDSTCDSIEFYTKSNGKLVDTKMSTIPTSLKEVHITGEIAGKSDWCKSFILQWANEITDFSDKILELTNIEWTDVSFADVIKLGNFLTNTNSKLGGYIMLSTDTFYENGVAMSANKKSSMLQQIRDIFGDSVFTLDNSGLSIDYEEDTLVITTDANASVVDNQTVLYEGEETQLTCTQFKLLRDASNTYSWYMTVTYKGNTSDVVTANIEDLGVTITDDGKLKAIETDYEERTITVLADTVTAAGAYIGGQAEIIIKKRNTPTGLSLTSDVTDGVISASGNYKISSEVLFPESIAPNTRVASYSWEIVQTEDDTTSITKKSEALDYLEITVTNLPDLSKTFTVSQTIIYKNSKVITNTIVLSSILDAILVYNQVGRGIDRYKAFVEALRLQGMTPITSGMMKSSDVARLSDTVDLSEWSDISTLTSMYGWINSLKFLNYMSKVTKVNLNGASALTSFDFGSSNWYTHIYLQDTAISSIDVSNQPIQELNLSGTLADIDIENKPITLLNLGTPKNIKIVDCPNLTAEGFTIDDYTNIETLEITGTNVDAFKQLANIYSKQNS